MFYSIIAEGSVVFFSGPMSSVRAARSKCRFPYTAVNISTCSPNPYLSRFRTTAQVTYHRSSQIRSAQIISSQIITDQHRSSQISTDHNKSSHIFFSILSPMEFWFLAAVASGLLSWGIFISSDIIDLIAQILFKLN